MSISSIESDELLAHLSFIENMPPGIDIFGYYGANDEYITPMAEALIDIFIEITGSAYDAVFLIDKLDTGEDMARYGPTSKDRFLNVLTEIYQAKLYKAG